MKATGKLLAAGLAVAGIVVAAEVQAQADRGTRSGAHSGNLGATSVNRHGTGQRHWTGSHHWNGHRHGGHHRWRGHHWGFYFGAPLLLGAAWGWPYYHGYYYPRSTIIYRDIERYPQSFPEGVLEPAPPSTEIPRGEDTPAQGPLYMNYCESAKAYFPKVTTCPEGWRFLTPTR